MLFRRDGAAADPAELSPVFEALRHRGVDGGRISRPAEFPGVVLGHWHFHATPEESAADERQPLRFVGSAPGVAIEVAFDGRLDNRAELFAELAPRGPAATLTDAALVARAHARWGEEAPRHLLGSFAYAVVDIGRRRVLLVRDAIGDHSLFFHVNSRLLLAASEAGALLEHPAVGQRFNETSIARFLAVHAPRAGETFFAAVREVQPAHVVAIDESSLIATRYWLPEMGRSPLFRRDDEAVEELRHLLRSSVAARTRTAGPGASPAVLMSGGLDSTLVAATAAEQALAAGRPPVAAISWVFDEPALAAANERPFIDAMASMPGLAVTCIPSDDGWPLAHPESWPWTAESPLEGLYRRLKERSYAAAHSAGCRVVLTGDGGDHLVTGGPAWLIDLLRERRWGTAAYAVMRGVRRADRPLVRAGVGQLLRALRSRPMGGAPGAAASAPWLTEEARRLVLDEEPGTGVPVIDVRRPSQAERIFDPLIGHAWGLARSHAHREGLEIGWPYRDRRLVQLFLDLPAHLLARPGAPKWIFRQAGRDLLPEVVRSRRWNSTLSPLAARGLLERETATVRSLLEAPDAQWPRYVRREWLRAAYPGAWDAGRAAREPLVVWRCLTFELWRRGWEQRRRGPQTC